MSARDIAAGLAAVSMLGRGRAIGLQLLDDTPEGAWRSFVAMVRDSPLAIARSPFCLDTSMLGAARAHGSVLEVTYRSGRIVRRRHADIPASRKLRLLRQCDRASVT